MPKQKLTNAVIGAAIEGFEAQKKHIDDQIAELRLLLDGGSQPGESPAPAADSPPRKRRKMSAAGRARIAEAQRKRWAELKKESETGPLLEGSAKPKRKLSAAGRKNIVAATKRRWARVRAQATKAAKAVRKKAAAPKAAPLKAAAAGQAVS